jgi:hypothetical protein
MPLFYFFRRSISSVGAGGVWALIFGSIFAVFRFFFGDLLPPGGFGFSRWMSVFTDIISIPVLVPVLVYSILLIFRMLSGYCDFANFILVWLIPVAIVKALNWSSVHSPYLLIIIPLLWTSMAIGISLYINCILRHLKWWTVILCGLGILMLFFTATTSYWAIFSQNLLTGYALFFLTMIPMLVSLIQDFLQSKYRGGYS